MADITPSSSSSSSMCENFQNGVSWTDYAIDHRLARLIGPMIGCENRADSQHWWISSTEVVSSMVITSDGYWKKNCMRQYLSEFNWLQPNPLKLVFLGRNSVPEKVPNPPRNVLEFRLASVFCTNSALGRTVTFHAGHSVWSLDVDPTTGSGDASRCRPSWRHRGHGKAQSNGESLFVTACIIIHEV